MTRKFSNDSIPEISSPGYRFQWEEAQQAYVILYPEGMVKLNDSAGEILRRCDGQRSVEVILSELNAEFPEADLNDDVLKLLEVAHEQGWIRYR